jgi:hypothetical protein
LWAKPRSANKKAAQPVDGVDGFTKKFFMAWPFLYFFIA